VPNAMGLGFHIALETKISGSNKVPEDRSTLQMTLLAQSS